MKKHGNAVLFDWSDKFSFGCGQITHASINYSLLMIHSIQMIVFLTFNNLLVDFVEFFFVIVVVCLERDAIGDE